MVMVKNIPVCHGANGNFNHTPADKYILSVCLTHLRTSQVINLSTYMYFPLNRLSLSCYQWTWRAVLKDDERARGGGVPPQESG